MKIVKNITFLFPYGQFYNIIDKGWKNTVAIYCMTSNDWFSYENSLREIENNDLIMFIRNKTASVLLLNDIVTEYYSDKGKRVT